MERLYYTISEVAQILGESVSLVRFWSNSFPKFVNPKRNAKGNRLYTKADLEALSQIHYLVKEQGLTLEGAAVVILKDSANLCEFCESLGELVSHLGDGHGGADTGDDVFALGLSFRRRRSVGDGRSCHR